MDVDFEFTVARLAKIANNNNFVGLLRNSGSCWRFVRDPFPACAFSTVNAVNRASRQKRHKRDNVVQFVGTTVIVHLGYRRVSVNVQEFSISREFNKCVILP